jgi:hypothetical protein
MKKLTVIYFLFLFCACEKDYNENIEVDFLYTTNVICLMTDDGETTEVQLSQIRILGKPEQTNYHYYAEAKVVINDGLKNYVLNYDSAIYEFDIDSALFKVAKGKSYTLDILLADGTSITSSCYAPIESIPNVSYLFKDVSDYKYSYAMNWDNDSPNEKYYISQFYFFYPTRPHRRSIKAIAIKKELNQTSAALAGTGKIPVLSGGSAVYIYPTLYYTSEETFMYYDAALKNVSGDLFGSPAVVPTNIVGGTGCFGALISK